LVWCLRGAWLALPLVAGPVLGAALDGASRSMQVVASAGLWVGWAGVLVVTLVPRTVSLTGLRITAPAAAVAVLAASAGGGDADPVWRVLGPSWAVVVVALAFAPVVGEAFADGSSYGHERRFLLRVPGPVLAGPLLLAWAAVVGGVAAGPLLLAARQWALGGIALVAGLAVALWGTRALHTLSRRWVVLVPGGLVLHDPLALADPVLFRRGTIRGLGPAPADSDALDLTRTALGLALELQLTEPATLVLAPTGPGRPGATVETDRLLFTPTRPGALLAALRPRVPT
jgi:hypothetical protein